MIPSLAWRSVSSKSGSLLSLRRGKCIDRCACLELPSDTQIRVTVMTFPMPIRQRNLQFLHFLLPLFLLCALGGPPAAAQHQAGMHRAQKHESRHEIDLLEDAWRKALLNADRAALESLLSDDYMAITASGTLQNKEQALANLSGGRIRFNSLELSDRKVRFYGATALVTSLATVSATKSEGEVSGSFRYTRVYVRDPRGAWKIVSFEASRIREPRVGK